MEKLYLLCNAHLDPVWLWQKKEGRAEALSTFRVAAEFCEEFDGFVFNHNEAVLYEWVEQEEPDLFERIQKLVRQGKWNIIGGTYLQADCNMPSGESLLRQIQVGQEYFQEKFGVRPNVGFHVDPFGHSRGLVQILKKMGYEHYIFMRPDEGDREFIWEGLDGSTVHGHRLWGNYNSSKGKAAEKIERFLGEFGDNKTGLMLWGIGNHGGGPSRIDLERIEQIKEKYPDIEIIHSDAKEYFDGLDMASLPVIKESLRPSMVGCYTSMSRIKQKHRQAENSLAVCKKMMAHAGMTDEADELKRGEKALLFNQFHDILPGTAIRAAEEEALRELDYAAEIFARYSERAFLRLCAGQKKAKQGEIPLLVYNPHPYPVEADVAVEFQLEDANWTLGEFTIGNVYQQDGTFLPTQNEREASSLNFDWRKNLVFRAKLAPMAMNRFDCVLKTITDYEHIAPYEQTEDAIMMSSECAQVKISKKTGLIGSYTVNGKDVLVPDTGKLCVFCDDENPWSSEVNSYTDKKGEFSLLSREQAATFADCAPIEVIENGDVRMKVQALFGYSNSFAVVTYTMSRFEAGVDVSVILFTNDHNVMIKYCLETNMEKPGFYGQTMFGTEQLYQGHREECYQKWCGLKNETDSFYVLNKGIYGGSSDGNELRLSLLRTPCYSALPVGQDRPLLMRNNRFMDRIDMGRRDFSFKLVPDGADIDMQAQVYNEEISALSFFPSGHGTLPEKLLELDNRAILMTAFERVGDGYQFRLYNSDEAEQTATVTIGGASHTVRLGKFEVKRFTAVGTELTEEAHIG